MKVSIVIPTLNEEKTIGICLKKIYQISEELNLDEEIIISDSSMDSTPQIAREMGAKVIFSPKKGYGRAYIKGIENSNADYIVMADADNTYDFLELPRFLNPLREGKADFVIGTRLKGKIMPGAMPWLHRYIGNPLLTTILNFLFGTKISDAHCGMRAFTRKAYEKLNLKTSGMEFASEMLIKAAKRGLRIVEVPISYYPRYGVPSKLHSFRDGWRHLRLMLLYSPTYVFLIPALIFLFIGLALTIFLLSGPVDINFFYLDIHPLILGNLFLIIGIQILVFWIYSSVYSVIYRGEIPDRFVQYFLDIHSLEKELLFGILLLLVGFIIDSIILLYWIKSNFGSLSEFRIAILASTLMIVGFQLIFSAIFVSTMLLDREE